MKKMLFLFISMFIVAFGFAQNTNVGYWIDQLPYGNVKHVVLSDNAAYGATDFAVVKFNFEDQSVELISTINGLPDIQVSALAYSQSLNKLVVGFGNGSFSIIEDNKIRSYFDIERANVFASKRINHILIDDNSVYFSCGFGIVKFDLTNERINETFIIGDNESFVDVNFLYQKDEIFYAATKSGIYRANANDPNIRNFFAWEKEQNLDQPNIEYHAFFSFIDTLFLVRRNLIFQSDSMFFYNDQSNYWEIYNRFENEDFNDVMLSENNTIAIAFSNNVALYDTNWNLLRNVFQLAEGVPVQPNAVYVKAEKIGIGDARNGLAINNRPFNTDLMGIKSPNTNSNVRLELDGEDLFVCTGRQGINFFPFEYYRNSAGEWSNFTFSELGFENEKYRDCMAIKKHPNRANRFYAASYINGVIVIDDHKVIKNYDQNNSNLPGVPLQTVDFTRVSDLEIDKEGNVWVSSAQTEQILSVLVDGQSDWTNIPIPISLPSNITRELLIDRNNNKWVLINGGGILVFNENANLGDTENYDFRHLTNSETQGELPALNVNAIVEDRNGEIWLGTDQGIAVIFNSSRIFDPNTKAQQILIRQDGFNQFLFSEQKVTAIAVDGANQKWIGTEGAGVFLMSADGQEQIFNFSKANSPLISNTILDIAVRPSTGEVFFSTASGLISYKAGFTEPQPDFSSILAYPNPVNSAYQGPIAIKGLTESTEVRITDVAGNLVYETVSAGGQILWNKQNMSNMAVVPGIYLVYCTKSDGSTSGMTKVLILE